MIELVKYKQLIELFQKKKADRKKKIYFIFYFYKKPINFFFVYSMTYDDEEKNLFHGLFQDFNLYF